MIAALVLLATVGGPACRDEQPTSEATSTTAVGTPTIPSTQCNRFVVLESSDWPMKEAVDYPADIGDWPQPHLDWFAEYERFIQVAPDTREGQRLNISGFSTGREGIAAQLPPGGELEEYGAWGIGVLEGLETEGAFIARPVDAGYTLTFSSSSLDTEQLVKLSSEVRPVCEEEWVASGGQILDCMPTEPGCIDEF